MAFIVATALVLTGIAAWGVTQSVLAVAAVTVLEAGTLLLIILLSRDSLANAPLLLTEMNASWDQLDAAALIAASFLAFYAFVGFEDMVNMAEETRNVKRTMPLAIFIAVGITVSLYLGVAIVAISLDDRAALAEAHTPLALLLPQGAYSGLAIGLISVLAGLNGALVQLVMASRVLYGMSEKGLAPAWFAPVNTYTRTPLRATITVGCVILLLATSFPLTGLAIATSFIILAVFSMVNLSLVRLRWLEGSGVAWLSLAAGVLCATMLLARLVL
jgi:amino acid transporter